MIRPCQARVKFGVDWFVAIVLPIQKLVIFADNGEVISLDECERIVPYKKWIDLTDEISGDDGIIPEDEK